jgi:hypothetical protein
MIPQLQRDQALLLAELGLERAEHWLRTTADRIKRVRRDVRHAQRTGGHADDD